MLKVLVARSIGRETNNRLTKIFLSYGIEAILAPIIIINEEKNISIKFADYQAILLTSFHSVVIISKLINNYNIPVFTVGSSTAEIAKIKGFKNIIECQGDSASMIIKVKQSLEKSNGKILYAGAKNISRDIPNILKNHGYDVHRSILYRADAMKNFDTKTIKYINSGLVELIVLLSNRGAKIFLKLAKNNFNKNIISKINIACLTKTIAHKVSTEGFTAYSPRSPSIESLARLIIKKDSKYGTE